MADEQYERANLTNIANGAVVELFNDALAKVLANIDDINTAPKVKRTITIEVVLKPDSARAAIELATNVKTKLAPPKSLESVLYPVRDRRGNLFAVNYNMVQQELIPPATSLRVVKEQTSD